MDLKNFCLMGFKFVLGGTLLLILFKVIFFFTLSLSTIWEAWSCGFFYGFVPFCWPLTLIMVFLMSDCFLSEGFPPGLTALEWLAFFYTIALGVLVGFFIFLWLSRLIFNVMSLLWKRICVRADKR